MKLVQLFWGTWIDPSQVTQIYCVEEVISCKKYFKLVISGKDLRVTMYLDYGTTKEQADQKRDGLACEINKERYV